MKAVVLDIVVEAVVLEVQVTAQGLAINGTGLPRGFCRPRTKLNRGGPVGSWWALGHPILGGSGGMLRQENFEILGSLRCILWPSEPVFNACMHANRFKKLLVKNTLL